jgi:hypothetical protein
MSRDSALRELRARTRDLGRAVRWHELPFALRMALQRHFGSLAAARRAAGVAAPGGPRRWSQDAVLRELRKLSRAGMPIRFDDLRDAGRHDLVHAIAIYVGSIHRARILARVPHPPRKRFERQEWDEARVVEEIEALHADGRQLASSKVDRVLREAGKRYFGSWREAIEAAGLDYDRVRLVRAPYGADELLDRLRALAARKPRLTRGEFSREGAVIHALEREFGSVDAALAAAGLADWPVRERTVLLARRQILAKLRRRKRQGLPVYGHVVRAEDFALWHAGKIRYGTWRRALAALRVKNDSPKQRRWNRALVLELLGKRAAAGASMKPSDVQRADPALYRYATLLFGSYAKAARRVGVTIEPPRQWTRASLIEELRRLARGTRLTTRQAGGALLVATQRHFGSFSEACRAAGLEVRTTRHWTRAEVIDALRARAAEGSVTSDRVTPALRHACVKHFGTFTAARRAADIE